MNPLVIKNILASKTFKYLASAVAISLAMLFIYKHIYNNGYEAAKKEYQDELIQELAKQKKTYEIVVAKAELAVKQEEKIKTVYKDRIVTIEKIVEKPIYLEPVLSNEDYEEFRKAQGDVK